MAPTRVVTLDLNFQGREQAIAAYLIRSGDAVVLIESGVTTVQALTAGETQIAMGGGTVAVRSARFAGGDPYRILVVLSAITAVASAFLDNVTTVVLVVPVTISVAQRWTSPRWPRSWRTRRSARR